MALAMGLGATLTACGGGTGSPATTLSPAQTKAAVTTAWTTFFDGRTAQAKQVALLQNGTKYTALITGIRNLLPPGTRATVEGVTLKGNTATVSYKLTVNGSQLLPTSGSAATGTAVDVNGQWKVSSATFCTLVSLTGKSCPS
jgi:hypothetical protein